MGGGDESRRVVRGREPKRQIGGKMVEVIDNMDVKEPAGGEGTWPYNCNLLIPRGFNLRDFI